MEAERSRPRRGHARQRLLGNLDRNGNDGTIARFGWKTQNKSLLLFSGEAYNVEMGITNELFQSERDETPACQYAPTPNDFTNTDAQTPLEALNGIEKFAAFMRFLAPPTASTTTPGNAGSIQRGRALFAATGCALCHTPAFKTGESSVAALSDKDGRLFSDLLLHRMGPGLADDILQGVAEGDEFRTAPRWGLGQRIFFCTTAVPTTSSRPSSPTRVRPTPSSRRRRPRESSIAIAVSAKPRSRIS